MEMPKQRGAVGGDFNRRLFPGSLQAHDSHVMHVSNNCGIVRPLPPGACARQTSLGRFASMYWQFVQKDKVSSPKCSDLSGTALFELQTLSIQTVTSHVEYAVIARAGVFQSRVRG